MQAWAIERGYNIDFGESDRRFSAQLGRGPKGINWKKLSEKRNCRSIIADRQICFMSKHEMLDFLVACRNALRVGGTLRLAETDWQHPADAYRSHAVRFRPINRFDVVSLSRLLDSVDLLPIPIEFYDCAGNMHEFEPYFEQRGLVKRSSRVDRRRLESDLQFSSVIVDGLRYAGEPSERSGFSKKIYAIGDSHTRFLAGHDLGLSGDIRTEPAIRFSGYSSRFVGLHLGPALAYTLNKHGSRNRAREKIDVLLSDGSIPLGSEVIFSFGEIDCRNHICEQSERQGRSIAEVVSEVIKEYCAFLDRIIQAGFRPAVWGVAATTWHTVTKDPENPIYGDFKSRQSAVKCFNEMMRHECDRRSLPFLCMFDKVHTPDGAVRQENFCDILHLSQAARPILHEMMPDGDLPRP